MNKLGLHFTMIITILFKLNKGFVKFNLFKRIITW